MITVIQHPISMAPKKNAQTRECDILRGSNASKYIYSGTKRRHSILAKKKRIRGGGAESMDTNPDDQRLGCCTPPWVPLRSIQSHGPPLAPERPILITRPREQSNLSTSRNTFVPLKFNTQHDFNEAKIESNAHASKKRQADELSKESKRSRNGC